MREPSDPAPTPQRNPDAVLHRNLERLLRHHRRVEPSEIFQRRLQMALRERQARGLGPRLPWRALTAAAVLLLALAVLRPDSEQVIGVPLRGSYRLAAGSGDGRSSSAPLTLTAGDRVTVDSRSELRLRWPSGALLDLEENTVVAVLEGLQPQLRRGRSTLRVATGRERTVATPVALVRARGAVLHISIAESSHERRNAMKKSTVGAIAAVGAVILVSVVVHELTDDGAVVVETPEARHELVAGDRGTFGSDGSVRLTPATASTAADLAAPTSTPTPEPDVDALASAKRVLRGIVQDIAGAPLPEANVVFKELRDGESVTVAHAASDTEGRFELTIDRTAAGILEAHRDRYRDASLPWQPPAETEEPAESPAVAGDSPPEEAEIVLTLAHETAIAGRVLFPDDAERPESMLVTVERYYDMYRRDQPIMRKLPADEGTFYFAVAPGKYRVWAYAEGYSRSREFKVDPVDGQLVEVDVPVKPGRSVSGHVFAKRSGLPVAGAIVFSPMQHLPGSVDRWTRGSVDAGVRDSRRTDAKGAFELADLPIGMHLIRVLHPDYMPVDQTIVIEEDGSPQLEFALQEGFGIRGQVLDGRGQPHPRAVVIAIAMALDPASASQTIDLCDETGKYHIRNLRPGPYIVVMVEDTEADEQSAEYIVQMVQHRGVADTVHDFIAIPEDATLRGRILDADGQPLGGIQVSLMSSDTDDPGAWTFQTARTNPNGEYEILNLALGAYMVCLSKTYGENFATIAEVKLSEPIDYERDFEFPDMAIEGRILSRSTGDAIFNAEIILLRLGEDGDREFAGRSTTTEDGKFSIEGLTAGRFLAMASGEGFRRAFSEPIELVADLHERRELEILLDAGGGVMVTVRDADGGVVPGALVKIRDDGGNFVNQGLSPQTDARGVYSFTRLAPGPYRLEVQRLEGPAVTEEFQIETTERVELEIALPRQ